MGDTLQFADGMFRCPVTFYPVAGATRTIIVLPALGVVARKYVGLAQLLAKAGNNVLVADWPGQGESQPRPSWRFDYGYRQLVDEFLPKLLRLADEQFPGTTPVLLGHSLGGHIATLYVAANPQGTVRMVGVACGNIHYRNWRGLRALMTPTVAVTFNVLTSVLGYLPGRRIGFGGHEARQLMRDWGRVAFSGHYNHLGLALTPAKSNAASSLFIQIEGDKFAPPASTLALAKLVQDEPQIDLLPSPRPARENAHSAWLRAPQSVADHVNRWLLTVA